MVGFRFPVVIVILTSLSCSRPGLISRFRFILYILIIPNLDIFLNIFSFRCYSLILSLLLIITVVKATFSCKRSTTHSSASTLRGKVRGTIVRGRIVRKTSMETALTTDRSRLIDNTSNRSTPCRWRLIGFWVEMNDDFEFWFWSRVAQYRQTQD